MGVDEFHTRAELALLHCDELKAEGEAIRRKRALTQEDVDRLQALCNEMAVVLASLREIHREQLIAEMPMPSRPNAVRRLWRGFRRTIAA